MKTDIKVTGTSLYFLYVKMRMPLKFGTAVQSHVVCARARVTVEGTGGRTAEGWGETPLSVGWGWPSTLPYADREEVFKAYCREAARVLRGYETSGHPMEIGDAFLSKTLEEIRAKLNEGVDESSHLPHLGALICASPFDQAIHDAYGNLHGVPVYETYNAQYMNRDLSTYLESTNPAVSFDGKYPEDFLESRQDQVPVWHLVGGLDPLEESDLTGEEPDDGYPVLLRDWIDRDGLNCLKIKLRGNDSDWDYERMIRVGNIAIEKDVDNLTADFNCTVSEPAYVDAILDKINEECPDIYERLVYVEQPFPYDLEANQIDVHSTSARKPLFMDESAHDWRLVKLGHALGWTGVALKTCKTQTGALLSLCWAKAHGMQLMVQDLTNPMIAQIPHVLLSAYAGTIMGVESNSMQFYPEGSSLDLKVHPGLYQRRGGILDLSTIQGSGFGYRMEEVGRPLPEAETL